MGNSAVALTDEMVCLISGGKHLQILGIIWHVSDLDTVHDELAATEKLPLLAACAESVTEDGLALTVTSLARV